MAQPLPNGVYPEASVVGISYLYVVGRDTVMNLYKVSPDSYTNSGSAEVVCVLSGVENVAFMAADDANNKLYLSDTGDGIASIWVVDLGDGTLSQFVTFDAGIYPAGLAVYDGYLYVTTNISSFDPSYTNQINLIKFDVTDSALQTILPIGTSGTYSSNQMVIRNYNSGYTGLYCFVLCNSSNVDTEQQDGSRVTRVDLNNFTPGGINLDYFNIYNAFSPNVINVSNNLVYVPSGGDYLSFVYSTAAHGYYNYIALIDVTDPSSPSLFPDTDYIPTVSNLDYDINSFVVDGSGNFIINFYNSYQFYGLPSYLELTYTSIPAAYTLTLPISSGGTINEVNWGDGTINTSRSHTYSATGTYTVLVNATGITQLNQTLGLGTGSTYLTSCGSFGEIGLTNFSHAFDGCTNLTVAPYVFPLFSTITNMSYMFQGASSFNQIGNWTTYVSNVTDVSNMFNGATLFNQDINGWFLQNVTDMSNMFKGASAFNCGTQTQFYLSLNTTTAVNMSGMFQNAVSFNNSINTGAFITSAVTNMSNMFNGAILFNDGNVNGLDVSSVTNMSGMFQGATAFNQTLVSWNVSNVTNMSYMFKGATAFNKDISSWNISAVTNIISMLDECGLSVTNYDTILNAWAAETVTSALTFAGYGIVYSPGGEIGHNTLATSPKSWTFYGDALVSTDEIIKNIPFSLTVNATSSTFTSGLYQLYYNGAVFSEPVTYDGATTTLPVFDNLQFATNVYRAAIVLKNNTTNSTVTTYYLSTGGPLTLTYTGIPSGFELKLPIFIGGGTISKVDWGDGTITQTIIHTYGNAGPYTVTVKVYGNNVLQLTYNPYVQYSKTGQEYLTSCGSFGEIGITQMGNAFSNCINLTNVPENLPFSSTVIEVAFMFKDAILFNQDISNWNVSTISNMSGLFYNSQTFNQDISNWDISNATYAGSLFQNAYAFNNGGNPLSWGSKTSKLISIGDMFRNARSFNQDISGWQLSSIENMSSMFYGATAFNNGGLPLTLILNTTGTIAMSNMFEGATSFNQDISSLDVSKVTTMRGMFSNATSFNNGGVALVWLDVSLVNTMQEMFYGASSFNNGESTDTGSNPLSWVTTTTSLTTTRGMFNGASKFNQSITDWDLSKITDMYQMFYGATAFNNGGTALTWTLNPTGPITMYAMFQGATSFNQDVTVWNVSQVTNMSNMFNNATTFNNGDAPLSWTTTTSVTDMSSMFYGATSFNVDVSGMDVSQVINMSGMFSGATSFNNGDASLSWTTTTSVTDMSNMFNGASAFNVDVSGMDVSQVINMSGMFSGAISFNNGDVPLSWTTTSVTNMGYMFQGATSFNQDISGWDVSNVTIMILMFQGATSFNQNLGTWDISMVTILESMLDYTALSVTNYNSILNGWAAETVQSGLVFAGYGLVYSPTGETGHSTLAASYSWIFEADALVSTEIVTQGTSFNFTVNITYLEYGDYYLVYSGKTTSTISYSGAGTIPFTGLIFTENGNRLPVVLHGPSSSTYTYYLDVEPGEMSTSLILTYRVPAGGFPNPYVLTLPLSGSGSSITSVDWGDGTIDTSLSHTYSNTVETDYTITFSGTGFTSFNYNYTRSQNRYLISCTSFGEIGLTSLDSAFYFCNNLTTVPNSLPTTSTITNMSEMFFGTNVFNQSISGWDVSSVTTMYSMFNQARAFNQSISGWNLSSVTNMARMFANTNAFNNGGEALTWATGSNTSNVTDMSLMFNSALVFNQDISSWDVSLVENMSDMFHDAYSFNQDVSSWNVSSVTNMSNMFWSATAFNNGGQALTWTNGSGTSRVTNMSLMFVSAANFNQDVSDWNVSNVTSMSTMFQGASAFNNGGVDLDWSDTSKVTDMNSMFRSATSFNQSVSTWNVSKVTTMYFMFYEAPAFNQDISSWTLNTTEGEYVTLDNMFNNAIAFNNGDTSGASNKPLTNFVTNHVVGISSMFAGAASFNQDVSGWDLTNIPYSGGLFSGATSFNQPLNSWIMIGISDISTMFYGATNFNQPLDSWDVSNVGYMESTFQNATSFNQDISGWNTGNVEYMDNLFNNASSFNQDLSNWNVLKVGYIQSIFDNAGLSVTNYNNILNGWGAQTVISGQNFAGYGIVYSPSGLSGHNTLSTNYSWIFYGDAYVSEDIVKINTDYTFIINAPSDFSSGDYQLYYDGKYSSVVTYDNQVDTTIPFAIIFGSSGNRLPIVLQNVTANGDVTTYYLDVYPPALVCFKEGSKILTDKGYKPVQDLRKGDLVKTLIHDYKPIYMIGKREIYHSASQERIKDQLYKCSQTEYPEIFEPLVITGCHSILVDSFISDDQREKAIEVNGNIYITDDNYRLPASVDPRASVYETAGIHTIYHLALENEDYYMNYGIYANGLLVESCSKRYLKELSNMTLIE
jgi:surface protein